MKKQRFSIFMGISLAFLCVTAGVFVGRNLRGPTVLVSVPSQMLTPPLSQTEPTATEETRVTVSFPLDLNTAKPEQLRALPGIGEVLALRIYAFRERRGKLHSVEELYEVDGIGEATLEKIRGLVYVGGSQ